MAPPAPSSGDKKKQIVDAAVAHLLQHGFGNSGIRALAKSAGMSDRMVMYYFATKDELIADALLVMAKGMTASLELLVPQKRATGAQILKALSDAAHSPEVRPVLRLWFEVVGRAVAGDEPYKSTATLILDNWEQWIAEKLGPSGAHRAGELLAQIEGQMMADLVRG